MSLKVKGNEHVGNGVHLCVYGHHDLGTTVLTLQPMEDFHFRDLRITPAPQGRPRSTQSSKLKAKSEWDHVHITCILSHRNHVSS
jgi:hypothetical protein